MLPYICCNTEASCSVRVYSAGIGAESMRTLSSEMNTKAAQQSGPLSPSVCPHHPQLNIVLPDRHAALVEVEQHTDAVALARVLSPPTC